MSAPSHNATTVKLVLDDGVPRFKDIELVGEPLRSWLDNLMPEELLSGTIPIEVPVEVHWSDDGPTLVVKPEPLFRLVKDPLNELWDFEGFDNERRTKVFFGVVGA